MKKTIVSIIIIGIFVLYCFLHAQANPVAVVPTASPTSRSSSSSTLAPTSTASPETTPTSGATITSGSTLKNGTYTGNVADAQWGVVQIQAQSAKVDIVSGATDTSEAFIQSLSNALSRAQA